ncbi:hypothetical protein [Acidaminococcus sp.]|uniref:hypothetical protein n=1 Tax=Acidaminococcus sp. TaxID=1872103 RepID=UPI003D7DFCC1
MIYTDIEKENGGFIDSDDFFDRADPDTLEDTIMEMPEGSTFQDLYDEYEDRTGGDFLERDEW